MELTIDDVRAAREVVRRHLPPTPMWSYPVLNATAGATVVVKHENTQPVGAFKIRGGLNLLAGLRGAPTITYSTGNHAQSMAYASHLVGADCTVVMPTGTTPAKVAAVEAWGADVILTGADLADAEAHATSLAAATGAHLVSPGDTPELVAGVGTLYLEILESRPDLDAIVVPIGSGSGAAAATIVARALAPDCAIIGVQSTASPAAHDAWRAGTDQTRPNRTRAEGLATGRSFALPQQILRDALTDFLLVTDDQIAGAQRVMATEAHTLTEGAGAAPLAAILTHPARFTGQDVAIVCTGANASPQELALLATTR
ncbi:threonine ammonia-lyase [Paractinoplanes globisporus]|uniref:Threonine/serine dehydratase n=1 Tax=Paractinoplanes globisporus TaxID=113565 RepID=A0ABW6WIZ6_9ACTN|nr:pyridoxal-phosphate dependent enzyme [Actinoplanes globisporus]